LLEAAPDDVVLDVERGAFHVAGTPAITRTWADLAAADSGLAGDATYESSGGTYPFGAHVAVVEVDTDTGRVRLVRMIGVDDAGRLINPTVAQGQVHGGMGQGIAQALFEEMSYDADGNPLTTSLAEYLVPSAAEVPVIEAVLVESVSPINALGAKGIGEIGMVGAPGAVQNAVVDALSHLGVKHVDMPCTAERVWRAIQGAALVDA
jgi:carbon-monoxide dehydrogenase large subunit